MIVEPSIFLNVPLFVTVFAPEPVSVPEPVIVNVPLFVNVAPFSVTVFAPKLNVKVFPEGIVADSVSVLLFNATIRFPLLALEIASANVS